MDEARITRPSTRTIVAGEGFDSAKVLTAWAKKRERGAVGVLAPSVTPTES
jgi:hypothetical protein